MVGDKLRHAKATLAALIDLLGPEDSLAIVSFNDRVRTVLSPTRMLNSAKELAHTAVRGITASGSTDLCSATLEALDLARATSGDPGHVMLLTDGAPTSGLTDDEQILRVVSQAMEDCTLSTFGYGTDVRPELLGGMSDAGRGLYHFVQSEEAPLEAFARDLGCQRAIVAVDVHLQLTHAPGVQIRDWPISAQVRIERDVATLSLSPMTAGDSIPIILGLELERSAGALETSRPWLEANFRARDVQSGQLIEANAALVPVLADEDGPFVTEVARELVIERCARAINDAAKRGPYVLEATLINNRRIIEGANLASDPQVSAAMNVVSSTLRGLRTRRGDTIVTMPSLARGISKRKRTMSAGEMEAFDDERSRSYINKMTGGGSGDGSDN